MAWWVEAHFSRCGTIAADGDGDVLYSTPYNSAQQLVAWVLSMGEAAELLEPPELRERLRGQLQRLADRLDAPAARRRPGGHVARRRRRAAAARRRGPDRTASRNGRARATRAAATARASVPASDPDWQVEADRFTRLATLMTYLHGICPASGIAEETPVPVSTVCAALDTRRAQLRADIRLLNLVNFGGEGTLVWAEIKGSTLVVTCDVASSAFARPARLSPLQVDTLLLAVEILGGQLPIEHGAALRSAAQQAAPRAPRRPGDRRRRRAPGHRRTHPRRGERRHRAASAARHRVLVRG